MCVCLCVVVVCFDWALLCVIYVRVLLFVVLCCVVVVVCVGVVSLSMCVIVFCGVWLLPLF